MKPDQHKRKKNDLYKKKHNIKSDKKEKETSDRKSKQTGDDVTREKRDPSQKEPKKVTDNEVDADFAEMQPEFRRRELRNNWERYELPPPEDDDSELRGADFQALLEATSSSVAQFQFEDEKDWMVDQKEDELVDDCLALDIKALSSALLTVPLHNRLQVPQHLFQEEQIKEIESSAAKHLGLYNTADVSTEEKQDEAAANNSTNHEKTETELEEDLLDALLNNSAVNGSDSRTDVTCRVEKDVKTQETEDDEEDLDALLSGSVVQPVRSGDNSLLNRVPPKQIQKTSVSKQSATEIMRNTKQGFQSKSNIIDDDEDDLDDLLSADKAVSSNSSVRRTESDDIDHLLNMASENSTTEQDDIDGMCAATAAAPPKPTQSSATAFDENVDAWLDDLLDD